ncbi:hypothetical protein PLICRDRAFT_170677 [Plicaturopsis crispa FD-325 SS-3]|nr:hypothetical protein PLICRDRAFT_170677 [Plicaturopsis crispa FD-325 SS-3]
MAPQYPVTYRLRSPTRYSPYRHTLRVERDAIPLHHRSFPLNGPLGDWDDFYDSDNSDKGDLIHRRHFPVEVVAGERSHSTSLVIGTGTSSSVQPAYSQVCNRIIIPPAPDITRIPDSESRSAGPSRIQFPGAIHPSKQLRHRRVDFAVPSGSTSANPPLSRGQSRRPLDVARTTSASATPSSAAAVASGSSGPSSDVQGAVPPVPNPAPSNPGGDTLKVTRQRHKIRANDQWFNWYNTTGDTLLATPPPDLVPTPQIGDIFTRNGGLQRQTQVWVFGSDSRWGGSAPGAAHPTLSDHHLWIQSKGEANWVTLKTLRTYDTRWKAQARKGNTIRA